MKNLIILSLVLALTGCTHFEKPGAGGGQTAADQQACEYQAEIAAPSGDGVKYADVLMGCMRLKGYGVYSN